MKNSLFLLGALVVGAASFHISKAAPAPGSKRPGPAAVQAARLKKYPPPGYLSHYLPDDRYKIAGGVWKYVSTDLDTYYHVPQSPNMMRQPADRVIGFANVRDAEEAGYIADPTDGTASKASPTAVSSNGSRGLDGLSEAENRYVINVLALIERQGLATIAQFDRLEGVLQQLKNQPDDNTITLRAVSPVVRDYFKLQQQGLATFDRLKAPPRMHKIRTLYRDYFKKLVDSAVYMNRTVHTGDIGYVELSTRSINASQTSVRNATTAVQALRRGASIGVPTATQSFNTPTSFTGSSLPMESTGIMTGPRGGRFHLSASGKKVYEKRGSSRSSARRRR
jgi:hypothetical protein